jgi:hypothetical protein
MESHDRTDGPFSGEREHGLEPRQWGPFLAQLAGAADLCLRPCRHAVRFNAPPPASPAEVSDLSLLIEARQPDGSRAPAADLDLEIYRSGSTINLMLGRREPETAPLLWQGQHPVWMDAATGGRCQPPADGAPLEALARRIRALVALELDP